MESFLHDEAGKINHMLGAIQDDRIGRRDDSPVALQRIVSSVLKSHTEGDGKQAQAFSSFIRHQAGESNGGIEKCVHASGSQRAQRILDGVERPVGEAGTAVAAMRGGGVPDDPIIGNEKRKPAQEAFHGDEDIVPVDSQALSLEACGGQELSLAPLGDYVRNHSAKERVALNPGEPVLVPDQLQRGLLRVSFLTQVSILIKCKLEFFIDIMDIIGILNNIENWSIGLAW